MSRDDGFAIGDMDTAYFDDAKMRNLWRLLQDEAKMARAVCLHKATLLASWRQGERVTASEACPLWLTVDDELLKALRKATLLDRGSRIPVTSWARWYEVAEQRRAIRRQAGKIGGAASGLSRTTDAQRKLKQPLTDAEPVRPSVRPSVPTGPSVSQDAPATDVSEDKEPDPADAYWTLTGKYPTAKPLGWIDDLTRTYGAMAVIRAVAEAHQADPATASLLGRAQDRLRREARTLDLRSQAEAQTQIQARRAAPRPVVDEAERQRVLRDLMGTTA